MAAELNPWFPSVQEARKALRLARKKELPALIGRVADALDAFVLEAETMPVVNGARVPSFGRLPQRIEDAWQRIRDSINDLTNWVQLVPKSGGARRPPLRCGPLPAATQAPMPKEPAGCRLDYPGLLAPGKPIGKVLAEAMKCRWQDLAAPEEVRLIEMLRGLLHDPFVIERADRVQAQRDPVIQSVRSDGQIVEERGVLPPASDGFIRGCDPTLGQADAPPFSALIRAGELERLRGVAARIRREWLTDNRAVADAIEPTHLRDESGIGGTDTDWQEVQGRLLAKRDRGEPYTSLRKLGVELKCSDSTVRKAIDKSQTLPGWKARHTGAKAAPKATDLGAVVRDNTRQTTEPAPDEVLPGDDVDATMARLIDQAKPDERAKLNALNDAGRRALVATYQAQNLDLEPSPLEPDSPGKRPRKVMHHKRA